MNPISFFSKSPHADPVLTQDPVMVLSPEVMGRILELLDVTSLAHACEVSRAWHKVANDPVVWRKVIYKTLAFTSAKWKEVFGSSITLEDPFQEIRSLPLDIVEYYRNFQISLNSPPSVPSTLKALGKQNTSRVRKVRCGWVSVEAKKVARVAKQELILVRMPTILDGKSVLALKNAINRRATDMPPPIQIQDTIKVSDFELVIKQQVQPTPYWMLMTIEPLPDTINCPSYASHAFKKISTKDLQAPRLPNVLEALVGMIANSILTSMPPRRQLFIHCQKIQNSQFHDQMMIGNTATDHNPDNITISVVPVMRPANDTSHHVAVATWAF